MSTVHYLPRDFIETGEGLIFAVVDRALEDGRVLCFLQYVPGGKVATEAANALLRERHPHYLHHSPRLDARLHAVPLKDVCRHHRPRERVREILTRGAEDATEEKLVRLVRRLTDGGVSADALGVTGSLLVGRQTPSSDLDVVTYGREPFFRVRALVRALIAAGQLSDLDEAAWRDAFERRGCELRYDVFLRHERRKHNKAMIGGTKFDLALIVEDPEPESPGAWRKIGSTVIRAKVLDDSRVYDQPARYAIDHPEIGAVLSFTHTYFGQAQTGETIEAAGAVEACDDGRRRLIVGSNREAPGEFIVVVTL